MQDHARPLHLVPLVAGRAPLVAEDLRVFPGRPGVAVVGPIVDTVGRVHVPGNGRKSGRAESLLLASPGDAHPIGKR